jgi:hypothetical protein
LWERIKVTEPSASKNPAIYSNIITSGLIIIQQNILVNGRVIDITRLHRFTMKKRKPHKKHWYRQYLGECPACGRDKSYRERVYGDKPNDSKEIYIYLHPYECYDWCTG